MCEIEKEQRKLDSAGEHLSNEPEGQHGFKHHACLLVATSYALGVSQVLRIKVAEHSFQVPMPNSP